MREGTRIRLISASLIALAGGLLVAFANPVQHIKSDLRSDAKGLVHSLRFAEHEVKRG